LGLFAFSCTKQKPCKKSEMINVNAKAEKLQLAQFIYKSGNIITNKECPYFVHASDIFYNKNEFLLIDIRNATEYEKGHIDGAYSIQRTDLMYFLNDSINPSAYKKIVIIDENGPLAEYVAMLLRFDGYNAYALKFGMATWNREFKSYISDYLSNKYANKVDSINYPKAKAGKTPDMSSENIVKLLDERVTELIALPKDEIIVSADEYFNNINDYYTIAYWSEAKYNILHIQNSVRYETRSDLSFDKDLNTIPMDKKVMVYCNTGHHAVAIVAYLRLLGYNASSLMYGVNSFMNKKFKTFAPGSAIIDATVLCGDFPLLTGKDRIANGEVVVDGTSNVKAPPVPIVTRKKKDGNVGGCE